jgi:hypothetical protein
MTKKKKKIVPLGLLAKKLQIQRLFFFIYPYPSDIIEQHFFFILACTP